MSLRKHQQAVQSQIRLAIETGGMEPIIADVTPGGGKSILPAMIQHELRKAGHDFKIAWLVPRDNLRNQGEGDYSSEKEFSSRRLLGHNLSIISATGGSHNPSRGLDGFITTYDSVAANAYTYLQEFQRHPYILCIDEAHHICIAGEDGNLNDEKHRAYYKAIKPLWDQSAYKVLMSGTLSRADGKRIAFVPYVESAIRGNGGIEYQVDYTNDSYRFVRYTRKDALSEKAIIRLDAKQFKGPVSWDTGDEGVVNLQCISDADDDQVRGAIYTAVTTELAEDILTAGIVHWEAYRTDRKWSKVLIVAPNQERARHFHKIAENRLGIPVGLAISDEPSSAEQIKRFKKDISNKEPNRLDALVTVGMAYEGLDVPQATHLIALTRIRSIEWLDQMVARVTRNYYKGGNWESQTAFIFAPDDKLMKGYFDAYMADQDSVAWDANGTGGGGGGEETIVPLHSSSHGARVSGIDRNIHLSPEETEYLEELQSSYGQTGSLIDFMRFLEDMGLWDRVMSEINDREDAVDRFDFDDECMTPSDKEKLYRKAITKRIRAYCYQEGIPQDVGNKKYFSMIMKKFGRRLAELDVDDLPRCWQWIQAECPLELKRKGA